MGRYIRKTLIFPYNWMTLCNLQFLTFQKIYTLSGFVLNVGPRSGANKWWSFGVYWYLNLKITKNILKEVANERFHMIRKKPNWYSKRRNQNSINLYQARTGVHDVTGFLQTDLFSDYLFREKTKTVPLRWRYNVNLVSFDVCGWSSGSCGSLIHGNSI